MTIGRQNPVPTKMGPTDWMGVPGREGAYHIIDTLKKTSIDRH